MSCISSNKDAAIRGLNFKMIIFTECFNEIIPKFYVKELLSFNGRSSVDALRQYKYPMRAQVRRRTYERDELNLLSWIFYAYRTYAADL